MTFSLQQLLALLSVLLVSLQSSQGQMSIPKGDLGFVYSGEPTTVRKARLAAYLDLTCPDSQAAYPTLKEVADYFGQQVELKVYLFPLPYHRNSHVLSKGANFLHEFFQTQVSSKNHSVFDWFDIIYKNMDSLVPSATVNKTDLQVLDQITNLATQIAPISPDKFQQGVNDRAIDLRTRGEWKYGCTRGVYGTPTFTVNDVFVLADPNWTVQKWVELIKPVL